MRNDAVAGRPFSSLMLESDAPRGQGGEDDHGVIAEADVLGALSDVEADFRGALAGVAAIDFEDDVFERESAEAPAHRWILVERDIGPAVGGIARGELNGRRGAAVRPYVDIAAVGAFHRQRRGHVAVVDHLDQEQAGAGFHQLGLGGSLLHFHAALGIDIDFEENVRIQDRLELRYRGGFIRIGDGFIDLPVLGGRQRLAEIVQRILELAHLLGERL